MCSRKRRSNRTVLTQSPGLASALGPLACSPHLDNWGSALQGPDCDRENHRLVFCDRISFTIRGHHPTMHPQASSLPALSQ